MRTLLVVIAVAVATPVLGSVLIIASWLGVRDVPGGLYDRIVKGWCRLLAAAGGMRVRVHGAEHMAIGSPRIYVGNHVSWFDVLALAITIPRYKFVAKSELFKVPIFGRGIRASGMVEIQRDNRKAAFEAYKVAAERIRQGDSVIVFPEGTRGRDYSIRPFKKGPFVLAIAAGVPIVPVIVHGTIEMNPKGSLRVRSGHADIHFLEPVPTAGLAYDDRDALSAAVRERMAAAMLSSYGIASAPSLVRSSSQASSTDTDI
jgi:1-acyl-sn-glycerol-3-phosphate acyltransferase